MPGYKSKKLMAEMKVTDYEAAFRKLVDKWHESVRHYEERIEVLEAANLKQSCIKVDDQMRIEKLEAALEDMAQYISRADWMQLKKETHEVWDLGGIND